jgi:sterol desaturase/sphingolipid hydroxylase (fatty acid hydroxylase superfamily)
MQFIIGLLIAIGIGDFGVYWVHRIQHWSMVHDEGHALHHITNMPRSWRLEFWSYLRPGSIPVALVAVGFWYWVSAGVGVGWAVGMVGYMGFAAFIHELYHTDPNLVFWTRPVHYFHHENNQSEYNFAFSNTWWDRLFGTFKDDPTWVRKKIPRLEMLGKMLSIRWV